jgi:hypothetical protein
MLTRYRGSLALKTWALDIARRSTMRKAPAHSLVSISRAVASSARSPRGGIRLWRRMAPQPHAPDPKDALEMGK